MPAGDRTGPMGMGPMTGRGAGYCAGYEMPGRGFGRGGGWGRGFGRGGGRGFGPGGGRGRGFGPGGGWGRGFGPGGYAPTWDAPPAWGVPPAAAYGPYAAQPTPEQETELLKAQAGWLKEQLEAISQRIDELDQQV